MAPIFLNLGWLARALVIISTYYGGRTKEKGATGKCQGYRFLEVATGHFHLHLTVKKLVMWSHLAARKAEKVTLCQTAICSAKIRRSLERDGC